MHLKSSLVECRSLSIELAGRLAALPAGSYHNGLNSDYMPINDEWSTIRNMIPNSSRVSVVLSSINYLNISVSTFMCFPPYVCGSAPAPAPTLWHPLLLSFLPLPHHHRQLNGGSCILKFAKLCANWHRLCAFIIDRHFGPISPCCTLLALLFIYQWELIEILFDNSSISSSTSKINWTCSPGSCFIFLRYAYTVCACDLSQFCLGPLRCCSLF